MRTIETAPQVSIGASTTEFGRWLKRQIGLARKSQKDLASESGCSAAYISLLVTQPDNNKAVRPSRDMVDSIADALRAPRSVARAAAGYADVDADLDFCADLVRIINMLPRDKQQPLKAMLRDTANNWAMFTTVH